MALTSALLQGSLVALVTPFKNGKIDFSSLERLVHWHLEQGTQGIVTLGTTGEAATIATEEFKAIIACVANLAGGNIPIIAGVSSNNPLTSIELAHCAQDHGADGVLCAAGYYTKPNQAGLYEHFSQLHTESDLPIILYNIPPRTVTDIEPETIAKLAELPRVIGIKDATHDLAHISRERALISTPFAFLSGDDMTAPAYNALGGQGCISVTANLAPQLCVQLQAACARGDFYQALEIHSSLVPLHQAIFAEPSPAGVKYALSKLNLCSAEVRAPIVPLGPTSQHNIDSALNALGLLKEVG